MAEFTLLAALLLGPPPDSARGGLLDVARSKQDGEVDRIMLRFYQRRAQARTPEQFKALLSDTRAALRKFRDRYPAHRDAERAAFHIAESYLSAGDPKNGLEHLRTFLKTYPASANASGARFAIGDVLLQQEEDAGARRAFEEFLKHHAAHPNAVFAKLNIAVTLQNERKFEEAARRIREVRRDHADRPESWRGLLQLAVLYHVQEKNADARAALEEAIRGCPDENLKEVARRHLTEYLKLGKPAPAFRQRDLKRTPRSLEELRGKVVILYFFDSSVPAASAEVAFLRRAHETFKDRDLEIVGVSVNEDSKDLARFDAREKLPWPLIYDGRGFDGPLPRSYGVRGLPSLTVIDRKGRIRFYNLARRDLLTAAEKLLEE